MRPPAWREISDLPAHAIRLPGPITQERTPTHTVYVKDSRRSHEPGLFRLSSLHQDTAMSHASLFPALQPISIRSGTYGSIPVPG